MDRLELHVTVEQLDLIMSALLNVTTPFQQLVQNLHEQANRQLNAAEQSEEVPRED